MENNTNQIKLEELKEVFDKIIETITPIIKSIANTITNIMSEINTKKLIEYRKLYEQSQWKYVKKGKKYVKVRRHNREDIAITFSRKIKHFKKKIQ